MTLVLDAGGISALAGQPARLIELRRRSLWPAQVPSVVLAEVVSARGLQGSPACSQRTTPR
ncbi:MAG TPA: hypothetical protein DHU96_03800 [Actinobacteria bacterium]|nr:hypothetical protein [Actinomycetota bacterium]